MKKGKLLRIASPVLVLALFLSLVAVVAMPKPAAAASAPWTGLSYTGTDAFYGTSVLAYETGATGTYTITLTNGTAADWTDVQLYINFDWGGPVTRPLADSDFATPTGVSVLAGEAAVLTVTFTVPDTATASNMHVHSYNIYRTHPTVTLVTSGTNFVVYSADQADARESMVEFATLTASYPAPTGTEAIVLAGEAAEDFTAGSTAYTAGDFATAKTLLASAVDKLNQAITADKTYLTGLEDAAASLNTSTVAMNDAQAALNTAQAALAEAQADAAGDLGGFYYMAGIGVIVAGIGIALAGLGILVRRRGS